MNTFQLNCFLMVADTLSFAKAAEVLHISQPAVTQNIQTLERELNVKLFNRSTRSVKLTNEGLIFIDDARLIVAIAERAKKRFENPREMNMRFFSLGCLPPVKPDFLTAVLKKLGQAYPNIHPLLRNIPFQHMYKLLSEGDADAVLGLYESDHKKTGLIYKELMTIPVVCVCPDDSPLAKNKVLTLDMIEKEKLIVLRAIGLPPSVTQLESKIMSGRRFSEFYFCESTDAAVALTEAGFGVCITPNLMFLKKPGLAYIPVSGAADFSFGIYYRTLTGDKVLRDFIDFLKEAAAENSTSPFEQRLLPR